MKRNKRMNEPDYVYILVRTDISLEQQTVQAIHAGMMATQKFQQVKPDTHLVLLAVRDQEELEHWAGKLSKKDIPLEVFFEPDNQMGYSALATGCLTAKQGAVFQRLPLWVAKGRGEAERERNQRDGREQNQGQGNGKSLTGGDNQIGMTGWGGSRPGLN